MSARILLVFSLVLNFGQPSFLDGVVSTVSNVYDAAYQRARCPFNDCCNDYWIPNDVQKLQTLLEKEVFGQHIATNMIYKSIKAHIMAYQPSKPLVMSFHGGTGIGKNHVAYLIARSLYRKEVQSQFYHHFMSTVHFPHADQAAAYQDRIRTWVKGNVTKCPQSLFVFDEVDKMPPGVMDGIRSYLDYIDRVDGVDYRRSIFIFLSNTGGKEITNTVHEAWKTGQIKREELTIRHFERLIELGAFNEGDGGLHQSHLIERSLIDVYVPFLPMEKHHVRLCARNEFLKQNFVPPNWEKALQTIVDLLNYIPKDQELYSTSGCKRVSQKVSFYVTSERHRHNLNKDEL